jgi:hypothetical protein
MFYGGNGTPQLRVTYMTVVYKQIFLVFAEEKKHDIVQQIACR